MVINMTVQNYFIIENDVVTNNVLWDGDTNTWMPPANSIQLVASEVPAITWMLKSDRSGFELVEEVGLGSIGFTWDGSVLHTHESEPVLPAQPVTTGTQTA
jgi:hypothetical protein